MHLNIFCVFQVKEWKSRKHVGGRAVICIYRHRSKTEQIVTLALSLEEEAVSSLAAKYQNQNLV